MNSQVLANSLSDNTRDRILLALLGAVTALMAGAKPTTENAEDWAKGTASLSALGQEAFIEMSLGVPIVALERLGVEPSVVKDVIGHAVRGAEVPAPTEQRIPPFSDAPRNAGYL